MDIKEGRIDKSWYAFWERTKETIVRWSAAAKWLFEACADYLNLFFTTYFPVAKSKGVEGRWERLDIGSEYILLVWWGLFAVYLFFQVFPVHHLLREAILLQVSPWLWSLKAWKKIKKAKKQLVPPSTPTFLIPTSTWKPSVRAPTTSPEEDEDEKQVTESSNDSNAQSSLNSTGEEEEDEEQDEEEKSSLISNEEKEEKKKMKRD